MSDPARFSLLKRSNGFYYVLYEKDGRMRWKSTRTRSKQEALRALTRLKDLLKPKPPTVFLSQFVRDFLEFAEGNYSATTKRIYESSLERFQGLVGDLPLETLTSKHIDTYKAQRLRNVTAVSVNIELRTLRAAMNVAVRWQLIERNPFPSSPLVKVPEQAPAYFSKEDFQRLLSLIKENWLKELIVFAVLTGMRRGEIVNLKWEDVDLTRKVIHVRSSPTFRTKQGKNRVVPMSDVVFHLLNSKAVQIISEFVFTLNGKKIKDDWPTQKLKYYVYEAKLKDDRLHFHSLRHTFASWLVQDGVSLYEVQKLLGHSSMAVTQVYSHLRPGQLHNTVNRISVSMN